MNNRHPPAIADGLPGTNDAAYFYPNGKEWAEDRFIAEIAEAPSRNPADIRLQTKAPESVGLVLLFRAK